MNNNQNEEVVTSTIPAETAPVAPAPIPAPAPQVNQKQNDAVAKILAGVAARNLGDAAPQFTETKEGSDIFLKAENWPTIKVGKGGGVTVLELRSYPEGDGKTATDAAIMGDVLLKKQNDRDDKKTAQPVVSAPSVPEADEPAFATGEIAADLEELEEELEEEEEDSLEPAMHASSDEDNG